MNPSSSPRPSSPTDPHRHKTPSKPLAAALGKVGVAIVDDEENFRVFLGDILDQTREFQCVGSYSSGEEALTAIPQSGAQILLMDIKMPGMSGFECARRLKALLPHLVILMVTGLDDRRTIDRAKVCGAEDFLLKPLSVGQFLATLNFWRPDPKAGSLSGKDASSPSVKGPDGLNVPHLSSQENELLKYLAGGFFYKEIADKMRVTEYIVRNLAHQLYIKIGVSNRTEAAIWLWSQRQVEGGAAESS